MLICYKDGRNKVTKDFTSVEMVCTQARSFFVSAVYSIVAYVGNEGVVLYSGLSEKKARHRLGEINFSCSSSFWGGGIYYV